MQKHTLHKITKKLFVSFILCVLAFGAVYAGYTSSQHEVVHADDLEDELEQLQEELEKIQQEKQAAEQALNSEKAKQGSLTSQINILSAEIKQKELEIKEKKTDIRKKETEIKILEEEITDARQQIEGLEGKVDDLELAAAEIVKTIYVETKTNSFIDMLIKSDQTQSFISQIQYHTALGRYDQNTLSELHDEKDLLEENKAILEDDKLEIEKLAEQIKKQKEDLEKDTEQLNGQIAYKNQLLQNSRVAAMYYGEIYDNLTDEQKRKEAELDYILQQIVGSATKPKGYVVKGQVIATEGNNGCSTGPHTHFGLAIDVGTYIDSDDWVNPCSYLPYRSFWYGSCGGNGQIRYPYNDPFYSSRGYSWYHKALDLYAGPDKYVRAAHNGYYFEEAPPCSNSWCSVGCKSPTNPCVKVCESVDCKSGKVSIYCHVNFL